MLQCCAFPYFYGILLVSTGEERYRWSLIAPVPTELCKAESVTSWGLSWRDLLVGVEKKMRSIFVLCVFHSFVCLGESFQMAKEGKLRFFFFFNSKKVLLSKFLAIWVLPFYSPETKFKHTEIFWGLSILLGFLFFFFPRALIFFCNQCRLAVSSNLWFMWLLLFLTTSTSCRSIPGPGHLPLLTRGSGVVGAQDSSESALLLRTRFQVFHGCLGLSVWVRTASGCSVIMPFYLSGPYCFLMRNLHMWNTRAQASCPSASNSGCLRFVLLWKYFSVSAGGWSFSVGLDFDKM